VKRKATRRAVSRRPRALTPDVYRPPPDVAPRRRSPLTVLVVDDDRDTREMYGMYLRAMDCQVLTAAHGLQAIEQATTYAPDVIVLDLAMPTMDGWEAAEHLKHSASTRQIPIIALTAQPGARESARISGCDAFLAKPCLPQLLWCEINLLLDADPGAFS
jgi:two-component system cell cycle response regulator DivK